MKKDLAIWRQTDQLKFEDMIFDFCSHDNNAWAFKNFNLPIDLNTRFDQPVLLLGLLSAAIHNQPKMLNSLLSCANRLGISLSCKDMTPIFNAALQNHHWGMVDFIDAKKNIIKQNLSSDNQIIQIEYTNGVVNAWRWTNCFGSKAQKKLSSHVFNVLDFCVQIEDTKALSYVLKQNYEISPGVVEHLFIWSCENDKLSSNVLNILFKDTRLLDTINQSSDINLYLKRRDINGARKEDALIFIEKLNLNASLAKPNNLKLQKTSQIKI